MKYENADHIFPKELLHEIRKYMRNIIPAKVLMRFRGKIIYREVLFTEY